MTGDLEATREREIGGPGEECRKAPAGTDLGGPHAFHAAMTVLIDYGIGNLRSLEKSFAAAGVDVIRTDDPGAIAAASRLVLPGVGAFGACAAELRRRGLADLVRQRAEAGVPLLGVCVGMQLLFEASEEFGEHAGLGLLPGRVVRIGPGDSPRPLKVPHMGWNRLDAVRPHPLLGDDRPLPHLYFVHSYHAAPADPADVIATVEYGRALPAVVGRGSVVGVQFHPEKSARAGLAMLRRFADWVPTTSPRPCC